MKNLSVKDFISFLSPCFVCGAKNKLIINSKTKEINADIEKNYLVYNTSYLYKKNSYFKINLTTSELETNDDNFFNPPTWMTICCTKCGGYSCSSLIKVKKLNNKKYISYVNIYLQSFTVSSEDKMYLLHSDFRTGITKIFCNDIQEKDSQYLDLPFTTTIKFKNKENLINKFKKLILFR